MSERPDDVEQFICNYITSVEQLEILLLLFRSPDTYWSPDALGHQLSLPADLVAARVAELRHHGLVREGQSGSVYRFDPADPEVRRKVQLVGDVYRERRISVINAIYSANLTRLRTFADAFRIGAKKEPKHE
ncbi:MAG TPA: hypothetical protein VNL91_03940 [Thermoanaerobaculia bacterium]|nr:hypothetical protein [Thermoanaerobaculia bacterium]